MSHTPVLPQVLAIEHTYKYSDGAEGEGSLGNDNTAGNMNFVYDSGDGVPAFVFTVGIRSGFLIDYATTTAWQVGRATGDSLEEIDRVPLQGEDTFTFAPQFAQAGRCGYSDEESYLLTGSYNGDGRTLYFSVPNNNYSVIESGAITKSWVKEGSSFWRINNTSGDIELWTLGNPSVAGPTASHPDSGTWQEIGKSLNFLWAIDSDSVLWQLNPATLAVIAGFETGIPERILSMSVIFDDFMWFIMNGTGVGGPNEFWTYDPVLDVATLISNTGGLAMNDGEADNHHLHIFKNIPFITRTGQGAGTETYRFNSFAWRDGETFKDWCREG